MPIDKILINRKITLIAEDLLNLKSISKLDYSGYINDYKNEILAERYLERIIGRMIDINYHIIVERAFPPPKDYYASFIQLGKLKILPVKLAEKLSKSAGLRNRLAHEYNGIDEKKVYQAVKECFADIPKYLKLIEKFITRKK